MDDIICSILEGCINSYTNNITEYIDRYNKENHITEIKTCITRRKENKNSFIINLQYNPKIIMGVIDIIDNKIIDISLRSDVYKGILPGSKGLLHFNLQTIYKNRTLKFPIGV